MFRPGKNTKDQTHGDETADHTPQTPSSQSYGGSQSSASSSGSSSGATGGGSDLYPSTSSAMNSRAVTEFFFIDREIKEF